MVARTRRARLPDTEDRRAAVSLDNEGLLAAPESITVKTIAGERFERITGWRLKERPVMRGPEERSGTRRNVDIPHPV